ncbi:TPA: phosphoribosyltransferase [Legionella pneumophila]|uniref:phosphoribosyltransferase n=1 Tax=Legionella pneumophila TaxID=446 RepID=UPI000788C4C5|nr:phosphoribosyltransferase [Legionella pneumophila]MDW8879871.1 phosphoribosyltransferase [Legionella pneumophila subsp. fraseri]MDW8962173.1 phosphoribosyltransferase [Legionella pneumophila subsp. fraseri]MDW9034833.1 phosphoribosyltransferase [Legionella pneumophila subsp. fraseri]MDW9037491.1 phosphoribosyltransferase [Legionella pneumophila subsp. fraseri]MDW9040954.1 phosphoribosyltransferase [Legionella pneumophila subsp. fraseri]
MERFQDRYQAGQLLGDKLKSYANRNDVIVLALPRGGVPVAAMISEVINAPLDLMIVRKLGVPGHEELAFGALASNKITVYNEELLQYLQLSQKDINQVISQEENELARRNRTYRGDKPFPDLKNKIVILVDDGIATGASMRVAVLALRKESPKKIIVAVPVAPEDMNDIMKNVADEYVCLISPLSFNAVGLWYEDFSQTEDEEVLYLLNKSYGRSL